MYVALRCYSCSCYKPLGLTNPVGCGTSYIGACYLSHLLEPELSLNLLLRLIFLRIEVSPGLFF